MKYSKKKSYYCGNVKQHYYNVYWRLILFTYFPSIESKKFATLKSTSEGQKFYLEDHNFRDFQNSSKSSYMYIKTSDEYYLYLT